MIKTLAFALLLAAAPAAFANAPVAVDANDFAAQRASIEKDLADGKTYAEISAADRGKVRASLDQMTALLEGGRTPESLTADQKVELYNQQETVNTILTQARADSRVVCDRRAATGSHRKTSTCATVAERERRRNQDQQTLHRNQRAPLPVRN